MSGDFQPDADLERMELVKWVKPPFAYATNSVLKNHRDQVDNASLQDNGHTNPMLAGIRCHQDTSLRGFRLAFRFKHAQLRFLLQHLEIPAKLNACAGGKPNGIPG